MLRVMLCLHRWFRTNRYPFWEEERRPFSRKWTAGKSGRESNRTGGLKLAYA